MTTKPTTFNRVSTAIVRGVMAGLAFSAAAGPAAAQDVTRPTSTFEAGPAGVGNGAYKAAEYSGLPSKGGFAIGHFDWRGGGLFDSDSALRWRMTGVDLGLDTRGIYAEVGVQGRYRLSVGYNGVRRNRSDSFQMPFAGAGTNRITLPGSWQVPTVAGSAAANNVTNVISARGLTPSVATAPYIDTQTTSPTLGGLLTPTSAQMSRVLGAANADLALFQNVNLSTIRNRYDLDFGYNFSPTLGLDVNIRPEHREGAKPMGVVSRATGGDISATIPDLIDTNTTQLSSNLNFHNKKAFFQAGYYGSFFRNAVPFMSFQNWAIGPSGPGTLNTMSSTPNSNFNQVNLSGGYNKSRTTRLTLNASYGRNTQNDAFLIDESTPVVPVNSLNGLVINTAFNARFSTKPAKRLTASAAYKYDYRDNRTDVHVFQFMDANQPLAANASFAAGPNNPLGPVLATNAGANRHINTKRNIGLAELEYAVTPGQWLKGGYDFQQVDRHCPGSWITCANADTTWENTGRAEWRMRLGQTTARVGYAYSTRRASNYNENAFLALVPYAGVTPAGVTGGETYASYLQANNLTGWGPSLGFFPSPTGNAAVFFPGNSETHLNVYAWENRIAELPGLRRFDVADRDRHKVRSGLDWAASDRVSIAADLDYSGDDFLHSRYGIQDARTLAGTADLTLSFEAVTFNAFYTYEDLHSHSAGNTFTVNSNGTNVNGATGLSGNTVCNGFVTLQERNNNAKLDPCLDWFADRRDLVHSAGVNLTKQIGELELLGSIVVSRATSKNNATGGNYGNNVLIGPGATPTNVAAFYIPATPFPSVYTDTDDLIFSGTYRLRTGQALRVQYSYQRMNSDDWGYEGLQIGEGAIVNVLPTNEQPFKYRSHAFGLGYVFSF
ncbi:MAG: MtrB/PioB family outer membrane beta-barrel protein [Vicinamibacterales bacterium]